MAAFFPGKIYSYDLSFWILEWTVADLCQLIYLLMIFKMEVLILKGKKEGVIEFKMLGFALDWFRNYVSVWTRSFKSGFSKTIAIFVFLWHRSWWRLIKWLHGTCENRKLSKQWYSVQSCWCIFMCMGSALSWGLCHGPGLSPHCHRGPDSAA